MKLCFLWHNSSVASHKPTELLVNKTAKQTNFWKVREVQNVHKASRAKATDDLVLRQSTSENFTNFKVLKKNFFLSLASETWVKRNSQLYDTIYLALWVFLWMFAHCNFQKLSVHVFFVPLVVHIAGYFDLFPHSVLMLSCTDCFLELIICAHWLCIDAARATNVSITQIYVTKVQLETRPFSLLGFMPAVPLTQQCTAHLEATQLCNLGNSIVCANIPTRQ